MLNFRKNREKLILFGIITISVYGLDKILEIICE